MEYRRSGMDWEDVIVMGKYSIGLDFGSLSGRAVMIAVADGKEIASVTFDYPDAVIDAVLPGTDRKLPADFALQNPSNFEAAVIKLLRDLVIQSGVPGENIIGIGVDATASTVLPVDEAFTPLCYHPEYRNNPHSWMKMWKHHSTQDQADWINREARRLNEPFLMRCGGKVSAEWYYPKLLETLEKAPEVFEGATYFVELGDWIVFLLTGEKKRSSAIASLHANWDAELGGPSDSFLETLSPKMKKAVAQNAEVPIVDVFTKAGGLRKELAEKTGLPEGTAVSMAFTDSPVALFSLGITGEDTGALILGTSSVYMQLSKQQHYIPGAMAAVKDQLLPGFYGNMFGQSAVGDVYSWFATNAVPYRYYLEAQENDESIFDVLNRYMGQLNPADLTVYALDWLNGSRSLLQDTQLTGAIFGLTLGTKPEHLYHSLVEATAFELKTILDAMTQKGVPLKRIYACGGITRKSPVIMQLFANVLSIPIYTVASKEAVGRGAAILGAVAAGAEGGGYASIVEASKAMHCKVADCYQPQRDKASVYADRYHRYKELYCIFGEEKRAIMHAMKKG